MSFLDLKDKTFLITGVANKRSVAYHVAKVLIEEGATILLSVQNDDNASKVAKLLPNCPITICDVEAEDHISALADWVSQTTETLDGFVHSIAFANFEEGLKPFHETRTADFLQAADISCFSLVKIANALKDSFSPTASVVTISISSTAMASENYGYMAPIKAALDSAVVFLAKSFSDFSEVRFNAVNPGLLKTSASAGIPGYLDAYLYAEQVIPRKRAIEVDEVANTVAFLLSPRSSGVNAQHVVVDAGMAFNYFDRSIIKKVTAL